MVTLITILMLTYAVICATMWNIQRKLLYFPDTAILSPTHYGLNAFSETFITAPDETKLQIWTAPAKDNYPTITYFHGNGGHLGYRPAIYHALNAEGFGVIALSYRGYGKSTGTPTESGLFMDAETTYRYATEQLHIPPEKLIIFGESLGTGVAVHLASTHRIGMVVLQSPFTSAVNRAAELYSWLPVRLLMKDQFDSISHIADIKAPLLLYHGERDTVVPVSHGRVLFAAAKEPKHAEYFPEYGHEDFDWIRTAALVKKTAIEFGLVK